ncbi:MULTISPECIES: hypothetical protein [unclassified Moorena]|uniref:hypothetical protein n=1 Tax=unclassified Moorena TaxID=2683338 RepID=UPI0013B6CE3B|nr:MULTISPECIES: hypothetical protein [unclassified Moorena]NEO10118.1 hypothetical protein [Moorena sp. SIO3I8]NEO70898.1 hypothetical protein [Moorena sp. SIO3H5]
MQKTILVPIQGSLGFALRGIRAQKDYINYLIQSEPIDLATLILAHPKFKDITEETFSNIGAKTSFISCENSYLDDDFLWAIAQENSISENDIITEQKAMCFLQEIYQEKYAIVFDNLYQPHPLPNKPSIFASKKSVIEAKNKLIDSATQAKKMTDRHNANIIFIPFSGLKAFGTDYGETEDEKQRIKEFMSFPFEDSIPAIGQIQKKLDKRNIIAIPVMIQYGSLDEIHRTVLALSKQYHLFPLPTSLNIDWNNNLDQQVGFFHALNQWSKETGLPNIALVHGSACLHLIEECINPEGMITFFATHTETLKVEDDGRIYNLAIAEASGGFLRAVQPPMPHSHNYRLVANKIVEQVCEIFHLDA